MPGSWYRQKSAECGRQALDANRTVKQRTEFDTQAKLWLQIADRADANEADRLAQLALRDKGK